jgi:hypothetical protein
MTQWDDESLLAKVRKLLAKAEDPACTKAEAEAFNTKAAELIAKYGIDSALAYADGTLNETVGDRIIDLPDPYAKQKAQLLVEISTPLRVQVIFMPSASRGIPGFRVHMFGFDSDIERVEVLLTSLLVQSAYGLASARPESWRPASASQLAAFRRDWLAGFGVKVRMRLAAAEKLAARSRDVVAEAAGTGGPSTEMVLASRSSLVEAKVAGKYPKIIYKATRQPHSDEAFRSGVAAGARADLGTTRIATKNNLTISGRNS